MTTNPSPEAIDAACHLLNKLDADHTTEARAASWVTATHILARAFDEFARQAVERALSEMGARAMTTPSSPETQRPGADDERLASARRFSVLDTAGAAHVRLVLRLLDECRDVERRRRLCPPPARVTLFVDGEFTAHSGGKLPYKVECDALTGGDIAALAKEIARRQKFRDVYGVPRGGERLAAELRKYISNGPILIVDDVLTTGASMEAARRKFDGVPTVGFVIFAHGQCPPWVQALWHPSAPVRSPSSADMDTRTPTELHKRGLLKRAEQLWDDLQQNELGGYSGINRPFWIAHIFDTVAREAREAAIEEAAQCCHPGWLGDRIKKRIRALSGTTPQAGSTEDTTR